MRYNQFVPYGVVALSAWTVGGVCGYAFSPRQPINVQVASAPVLNPGTIVTTNVEQVQPSIGVLCPESAQKPVVVSGTSPRSVTLPIVPDCGVNSAEFFRLNVPKGWPVVVVRDIDEESVWYVQDQCEQAETSLFTCTAVFGNASTPSGTKFELAAIVVASAEEAKQYGTGTIMRDLPAKTLITPVVSVVRR